MAALVTAFPMHYGGRVVGRGTAFMPHPMSYLVWSQPLIYRMSKSNPFDYLNFV